MAVLQNHAFRRTDATGAEECEAWNSCTSATEEYLGITLSHLFDALGDSTDTGAAHFAAQRKAACCSGRGERAK